MRGFLVLLGMDLKRSRGMLALSSLGILLIAALLSFLLGFVHGIERAVIPAFLPLDRLELRKVEHHFNLGPLSLGLGTEGIGEKDLDRLRKLPGVREVYPGLNLAVPAVATGGMSLLGTSFSTELAVQGLDPELVRADVENDLSFKTRPEDAHISCRVDGDCDRGLFCSGPMIDEGVCRPPIPVLISPRLIRLFNSGIRRAYHLPRINPDALVGLTAEIQFGASTLGGASREKVLRDHLQLVGYSERATPVGISIPLGEVRRVHRFFSEGMLRGYDTVVVLFDSVRSMTAASEQIPDMGFEAVDQGGARMMSGLAVARKMLLVLASVILFISALGLFQGFVGFLERRREEISVLRAVGASKTDILLLIVTESALGSGVATLGGILLGWAGILGLESMGRKFFPAVVHGGFFSVDVVSFSLLGLAIVLSAILASALSVWMFLRRSVG